MKREYSEFFEEFGDGVQYASVTEEVLAKFRGRLPDSLLEVWQEQGWSSYGDGLFWTVNPEKYTWLVDGWVHTLEGMSNDSYFVIARDAFGEFYCVRQHGAKVFTICCPFAAACCGPNLRVEEINHFRLVGCICALTANLIPTMGMMSSTGMHL